MYYVYRKKKYISGEEERLSMHNVLYIKPVCKGFALKVTLREYFLNTMESSSNTS